MEWDVEAAIEHEELEARTAVDGLVLGRYRLERRLGSGGFGTVYSASDERLRRHVAIKVIPRGDTADARVAREARVAARLNHPSVVALYELGEDEHNVYLVSELVEGKTLAELITDDALSDRDIARIGAALCDGLAHAHQRGVVHRDIKPQNVMVVAEPAAGMGFAKLADFGVAHLAGDDLLTHTGDVVGTLAYMAPEQAEGARVTWEADVYSLALSLYEAWTGVNPVRRRGPAATARQLGKRLPSLGRMRKDLPPELVTAIDLALDPRAERRPSPEELAEVFGLVVHELSDEGALGPDELDEPRPARLRIGMRGRAVAAAGAAGLVLAALETLAPATTFSPFAAATLAAAAVALLPRVGWFATTLTLCGWLASPLVSRDGVAAVLLVACVPIPFLLRRAPATWSLPVAAPAAAALAAAPAYLALAGQAATWRRRAALGLIGWVWIALAEAAVRSPLFFGLADGQEPRREWMHDGFDAIAQGVAPAFATPAALSGVVFAVFAAALPVLVRGLRTASDILGAAVWASGLYAAIVGVEHLAGTAVVARGALLGTCAAALLAVLAAAARRRRFEAGVGRSPVP